MGSEKTTEDTITTVPAKDTPALVKKNGRESEMRWLPACKIRRFMVVWRYENRRESRWED